MEAVPRDSYGQRKSAKEVASSAILRVTSCRLKQEDGAKPDTSTFYTSVHFPHTPQITATRCVLNIWPGGCSPSGIRFILCCCKVRCSTRRRNAPCARLGIHLTS